MASEIFVNASLRCSNGSFQMPTQGGSYRADQAVVGGAIPGVLSIPTTAGGTVVDTTALTSVGWCWMKNLDDTNYVTFGPTSAGAMVPVGKMKPGESCLMRLAPGVVLRLLANTAACKVHVMVLEA